MKLSTCLHVLSPISLTTSNPSTIVASSPTFLLKVLAVMEFFFLGICSSFSNCFSTKVPYLQRSKSAFLSNNFLDPWLIFTGSAHMVTTSESVHTGLHQIKYNISVIFVVTSFYSHHIVGAAILTVFCLSIIATGLSFNLQSTRNCEMFFVTYLATSCFLAGFTSVMFENNIHTTITQLLFEQESASFLVWLDTSPQIMVSVNKLGITF